MQEERGGKGGGDHHYDPEREGGLPSHLRARVSDFGPAHPEADILDKNLFGARPLLDPVLQVDLREGTAASRVEGQTSNNSCVCRKR